MAVFKKSSPARTRGYESVFGYKAEKDPFESELQ
jgi:hypothetical protein